MSLISPSELVKYGEKFGTKKFSPKVLNLINESKVGIDKIGKSNIKYPRGESEDNYPTQDELENNYAGR